MNIEHPVLINLGQLSKKEEVSEEIDAVSVKGGSHQCSDRD